MNQAKNACFYDKECRGFFNNGRWEPDFRFCQVGKDLRYSDGINFYEKRGKS